MNCSDYISMTEAFSLPYAYREIVYEVAKEKYDEMKEG